MPKSYESLGDLVEDSAKKAKRKEYDESRQDWKLGYNSLNEGALGDYPNE
jgi:hypothetical protein